MKKIAPLFFILCLALGVGIFIWTARHQSVPAPTLAPKHPTVSAQKGPLKLTLTLYSDTVARNGPLWFRLSVTNVGKKPFDINNPIFAPYFLDDGNNLIDYFNEEGFYLVVLDNQGKEVPSRYEGRGLIMDIDPCLGGYDWNWSWAKIKEASDKFGKRYADEKKFKALWKHVVNPGQSLETIAWSYHGFCNGERANPPTPPGRFAELYGLDISKPGSYRIYAGLNHVPAKKEIEEKREAERIFRRFARKHGLKISKDIKTPEDAVMRTAPIPFEVLP